LFDWDVIVIGGGPAGLAAGLYLARANLRALLIEEESFGGKIKNVEWIENYPGFSKPIAGVQLANEMQAQAEKYGLKTEISRVSSIELFSESRWINCTNGRGYTTDAVIVAAGSHHKKLNVPGEEEFKGRGVFECAFCDGGQFASQTVAVCGGGDSGVTEALYMSRIASSVILLEAMPKLNATALLQERLAANPKIAVRCGVTVTAIKGAERVQEIDIQETGRRETLKVDGVLVQVGFDPNTNFLGDAVPLDDRGQVQVDIRMQTSLPYIFAAGDVRSCSPAQVSAAVGDGAAAAISAIRYLQGRE
jgi:thioredoxin reductase (NADPH)